MVRPKVHQSRLTSAWSHAPPARGQTFPAARRDLELDRINPADIEEGAPVAKVLTLTRSPDTRLASGLWECTAGKFKWTFWLDEILYVLDGEAIVREEGGAVHHLHPGEVAYFPFGLVARWEIPSFIRKLFVVREPAGTGRIARAKKRLEIALRAPVRLGLHRGLPRGIRHAWTT